MNYSASNTDLWNLIVQVGIITVFLLLANVLRRKISFFRKSLLPTAVLAGFLFLIFRTVGLYPFDTSVLEMLTYHGIAIGFIALSLRATKKNKEEKESLIAPKSGALIVSTYLVQGIAGLIISLLLFSTVMPRLFAASGILFYRRPILRTGGCRSRIPVCVYCRSRLYQCSCEASGAGPV